MLPIGFTNEVLAYWHGSRVLSPRPKFESLLRISFFLRIRPRDIYINIVILLIETAATVEQLVKLCVSFAEHQGSIPVSLKFFFSKLKSTNTWSCRIVVWRCSLVLETKVQTPYPLIFPIFLSLFFLVSGYLVFYHQFTLLITYWFFYPLIIPVRGLFSFCIFVFSPCDAFFIFLFVFLFSHLVLWQ